LPTVGADRRSSHLRVSLPSAKRRAAARCVALRSGVT
jgi:hypothetical protein